MASAERPLSLDGRPSAKAFLAHGLADAFEVLRVSAAIQSSEPGWQISANPHWRALHSQASLTGFELQHGVQRERERYNARSMAEARRTGRPVLGHHAGLSDFFVPIVVGDRVPAILATGPFATERPTSASVLARWRWITGRQGHPDDPEFARFLSLLLSTLTLEGALVRTFERFLVCVSRLMAQDGDPAILLPRADALRIELERARFVERTWDAARSMIDEQTARSWSTSYYAKDLVRIGLVRLAEQVLVGLISSRGSEPDPVDELLRRDALQRACVDLAFRVGHVIAGRVGDHGVMFLSSGKQHRLLDLGDRAAVLARRRFGFELHLGLGALVAPAPLAEHYDSALEAAEAALSRGERLVRATPASGRATSPLFDLRRRLAEVIDERPSELPAIFDRYLETLAAHAGYRIDSARGHLEAAFEHLAGALLDRGVLDDKTFRDASRDLGRSAREARTVTDLFSVYRRVVADLRDAAVRPAPAQTDRSLRRAVVHMQRHYAEPLRRSAVARIAGFSPSYFSTLFRSRERMTFEQYLRQLRVERARQLLTTTALDMQRVAELSGLGTRYYLSRVLRHSLGASPLEVRRRERSTSTRRGE